MVEERKQAWTILEKEGRKSPTSLPSEKEKEAWLGLGEGEAPSLKSLACAVCFCDFPAQTRGTEN